MLQSNSMTYVSFCGEGCAEQKFRINNVVAATALARCTVVNALNDVSKDFLQTALVALLTICCPQNRTNCPVDLHNVIAILSIPT